MKIILLGPIASWQLYTAGSLLVIGLIIGAFFIFQNIRKNKGKK